jgi:hypothetical protein
MAGKNACSTIIEQFRFLGGWQPRCRVVAATAIPANAEPRIGTIA